MESKKCQDCGRLYVDEAELLWTKDGRRVCNDCLHTDKYVHCFDCDEYILANESDDGEVCRVCHCVKNFDELLEACKYALKNLQPKGNIQKDFAGHNAKATLSKAIARAEGNK